MVWLERWRPSQQDLELDEGGLSIDRTRCLQVVGEPDCRPLLTEDVRPGGVAR